MDESSAWLSAVTALCAVILGPLVSIYVVNRQAHVQIVLSERKERIKELRRLFSEFIAYLMVVNSRRSIHLINYKEAGEKLERAFQLETEMSLMLDGNVEDHRAFLTNITEARNRIFRDTDDKYNPLSWEKHYYDASAALIRILKTETMQLEKLK